MRAVGLTEKGRKLSRNTVADQAIASPLDKSKLFHKIFMSRLN
jgi:hypothetical protein